MAKSHAQSIAWNCVTRAKKTLGEGWSHVSDDVRWGLVCSNVMAVVASQSVVDDVEGSETEWSNVGKFAVELWREAAAIQSNGWKR